ncbi:hypothetical protein P389DRAFT_110243 [Cystobasidium minutum MCA 4210]|uniref:uncharacterized protein n=1 Tax=Cystobasidium minutum MCA 4210 TaxID=1397322 RepID=UPI0034CECAA3|eukprot:jgi/Rhomi1/110243/CE110242_2127
MASSTSSSNELPNILTDFNEILAEENSFTFDTFTSDTAFSIGSLLRQRIPELVPHGPPAAIHIALATGGGNTLFHAVSKASSGSGSSIAPDNDTWIARKKDTVFKWGISSYALHYKFKGLATQEDVNYFGARYGTENIGRYCLFGGGFPVRIKGVDGVVAVIIVSGLKHFEDHYVIVKVLQEWFAGRK